MHNYHKSLAGYLSMIANISLIGGVVMLFFRWHISIFLFAVTVILWFTSRHLHKKRALASLFMTGLNKSAKRVARKYKSPEGIAELKRKGFTHKQIQVLQKLAEEDAKKGVFRKDQKRQG